MEEINDLKEDKMEAKSGSSKKKMIIKNVSMSAADGGHIITYRVENANRKAYESEEYSSKEEVEVDTDKAIARYKKLASMCASPQNKIEVTKEGTIVKSSKW